MRKNIITFGTFDLLHVGHINFLSRASQLGRLIVGIATDELSYRNKNTIPVIPQEQRIQMVQSICHVSEVFLEENYGGYINIKGKKEYIKKYGADILVMGNDWEGTFDYLNNYCEVIYLERTKNISTTQIINKILER
ncbi:adenylyltransferase/cytidyltransferase family protein [Pelistega sp. MC2]|uniref:adenylyltransferase/cytidyltransferase family protein n=1 Tax=Pelistega sp. MC2 TaxID=1720297 RepID=UPI0008DAB419|nr:adenylyltransferase/cytidyltransferase family protein [Pelistega sp. MC2]